MFKTHFDPFVCEGDSITCAVDDIEFTARLEHDWDSSVHDADCYRPKDIAAWKRDEWHFFGLVISATQDGVDLGDHLASLWGIEGNFPSRKKNPNKYFREAANDLLPEALEEAKKERARIIATLTATT
jgi:hypothetical protein